MNRANVLLVSTITLALASALANPALAVDSKPGNVTDGKGSCPTIFGGASSEWYICDFLTTTNGLPAGGSCNSGAVGSGAGISDAALPENGDAFDNAGLLWINNVQVGGVATISGNRVDFASPTIDGLNVALRHDVLVTTPVARILLTLTNPSGSAINVPVDYATNFGSDESTIIRATSSGDTSFTVADRWVISSETLNDTDPVNTTVLWGGTPQVTPQSVSTTVFDCADTDGALARFQVSVPAGGSVSLLFFQRIDQTTANATAASSAFDNVVAGSPLLDGLTPAQFANVVNYNIVGPVAAAVSVPAGQNFTWFGLALGLGLIGAVLIARRQA